MDGSRIRKEKVTGSKISGYLWTGTKLIHSIFTLVMVESNTKMIIQFKLLISKGIINEQTEKLLDDVDQGVLA